ncbi:MAG TPA: glycosyltransferase [Acidimicrobiales bacterium]|nr:glycosyltransferase [Acidimicrobiales bacterium]
MAVHQVVVSASTGDAVTNFALELRSLYREGGESELFSVHVDPALLGEVHLLRRYHEVAASAAAGDTIVYHASIGNSEVVEFLLSRPERLVLVYHNVSPPESFAPYEPAFAALLRGGRDEIARLRPRVDLAVAVSQYNASDLAALGYRDVQVAPLIIEPDRLLAVEPDPVMRHHISAHVRGPMALFVGQLLPHKRPELLVEAFHIVSTYLEPSAHLVLLGARRIPAFAAALQRQIVELGLANAWITGALSDTEVRAYFDRADVFVTASDHEGFCVPLLEAMSFGIPVVARGTSAVPETLGEAGLIVPPDDGPMVFAEAWAMAADDAATRAELIARGRARLHGFEPDAARARWRELVAV